LSTQVSRAMMEQAAGITQMKAAMGQMRREADQLARAMVEQTRAIKDMTGAAENIAYQIELITHANREHSTSSATILRTLTTIREITDHNIQGVKVTQQTAETLRARAESLISIIEPAG
jgi:methyl-accepting chemotaxis protein